MTDLNSTNHGPHPGKRVARPSWFTGLRRRWKIGAIAGLLVFCVVGFFFDPAWGLGLGAAFGIALPLFLEYLDRTVKRSDDVRIKLGMTVLGTLPRFPLEAGGASPERRLISSFAVGEPLFEAYRLLCLRLRSMGSSDHGKVIMVTSCIPGEGKSTVAANLATSLAESGVTVLLVGCDLRRPTLCELFGETPQPGLSDLLAGSDKSGIRKLTSPSIAFLPAGNIPPNPAELLDSEPMQEYLKVVRKQYDYVVLDAPPVLAVTDSQILAPLCDLRLMVLEPCRIPLPMAKKLIETLQSVETRIDGVVLNDRSGRAARYYGGDGEYGRAAVAVSSQRASAVSSGSPSMVEKWLVGTALLLAVVLAGLSWQVVRKGEAPEATLVPKVDSSPTLAGTSKAETLKVEAPKAETLVREPAETSLPAVVTDKALAVQDSSARIKPPVEQTPSTVETSVPEPRHAATEHRVEQSPPVIAATIPEPVAVKETRLTSESKTATATAKTTAPVKTTAPATTISTAKTTEKGLEAALAALAHSWQRTPPGNMPNANLDVVNSLKSLDFLSSALGSDLTAALQCGTPLLLETDQKETGTGWITVIGRKGYNKWQVTPATRQGDLLSESDLKRVWTGKGYLPWQDPLHLLALEAGTRDPERMVELQKLLVKTGYLQQFERGVYDRETVKAIGHLQAASGLTVNGRITPETLVLLYQADPAFMTPKFRRW